MAKPQGLLSPVERQTYEAFGMLPDSERLSILPRYSKTKGLLAPQFLYDAAQAISSPATAAQGYELGPQEALNVAMTAAGGSSVATAPKGALRSGISRDIKPVKPLNNPLNTLERMAPFYINYPKASDVVDNLKVGDKIKNMDSIPATFSKYEIDKGIRSVPISEFQVSKPNELFRSSDDIKRVNELAKQIKANKYIDPLIVAVDKEGTYVLEGGHRLGALNLLGVKNLPAVVVRDLDY